jgi:hypothetical protein
MMIDDADQRDKNPLSMALASPVEPTPKVYQVGAENTGLGFYSIPINGLN